MMKKWIKIKLLCCSMVLFSACTSMHDFAQPNDPYYAPSQPQAAVQPVNNTGSLFNNASAKFLFRENKARQVGDLLTIVLTEQTQASKKADTELKKDQNTSITAPTILESTPFAIDSGNKNLGASLAGQRQFKAEADSEQSNKLNGTITVTVAQVYPNGNLFVKGEKWINLNQGDEYIRISGIVRPDDIATDNTITSTRLANARIAYSGRGPLNENNQQGWLARFFNSGWWPF